jgi:hypothetical protein
MSHMLNQHFDPRAKAVDTRRSQRVLLRVPVRADIAGEPPLSAHTTTLIVNAHGALILLAMKVRSGSNSF